MQREDILKRIDEIKAALDQASANYNALVGRLEEAKYVLNAMDKKLEAANAAEDACHACV